VLDKRRVLTFIIKVAWLVAHIAKAEGKGQLPSLLFLFLCPEFTSFFYSGRIPLTAEEFQFISASKEKKSTSGDKN
jgi:hypothetical protein